MIITIEVSIPRIAVMVKLTPRVLPTAPKTPPRRAKLIRRPP